jgi:predicted RNA-binding protein with PIN domain
MSAHYLVVDGHSVIYAWPELRELHHTRPATARDRLIQILSRVHDTGTWKVTLVFDGRLGRPAPRDKRDMVVHYSSEGETADAVIEKLVASQPKLAHQILVITADEAERRTVEALGAGTALPRWLEDECEGQGAELEQKLKQVHRKARWNP